MVQGTENNEIIHNDPQPYICPFQKMEASIHLIDTDYVNFLVLYRCQKYEGTFKIEILMLGSKNNANPERHFKKSFEFFNESKIVTKSLMKSGPHQYVNDEFKNFIQKKCNVTFEPEVEILVEDNDSSTMMMVFFVQLGVYIVVYLVYLCKYSGIITKG